jgi:hypothetical protein
MRTCPTAVFIVWLVCGCYRSYGLELTHDVRIEDVSEPDPEIEDPYDPPEDEAEEPPCSESSIAMVEVVPDVMVLLDRSGSMMTDIPYPPYRPLWHIITMAILDIVAPPRDSEVWFGFMTFPGPSCECTHPLPSDVMVEPASGSYDEIVEAFEGLDVCGGTPIALSLQSAGLALRSGAAEHPKYILLATDGIPNCNPTLPVEGCICTTTIGCEAGGVLCLDNERTYDVLEDLCEEGIKTFVLGMVGIDLDWYWVLEDMAGRGCTGHFYPADRPEDIEGALDDIMRLVADCNVGVRCSRISDPELVNFYARPGDEVIPRNPLRTSGWDWLEPCDEGVSVGQVGFFADDCEHLLDRGLDGIRGKHGCPTVWFEE